MLLLVPKGRKQRIDGLAFSPTGDALLAFGNGSWLDVWRLPVPAQPERHLESHDHLNCVTKAAFIDAGRAVVAAHGTTGLRVHPLTPDTAYRPAAHEAIGFLTDVAVTTDGARVVGASHHLPDAHGSRGGGLQCWKTGPDGQIRPLWEHRTPGRWTGRVAISAHYKLVANSDSPAAPAGERQTSVVIRDTETGAQKDAFPSPAIFLDQLLYDPTGNLLVARYQMVIVAWQTNDYAQPPRRILNDNRKNFTGIAFHPSGRYLAATSNDKTVKLYDTATWEVARTFTWEIGRMRSIAFSPDGTLAAAGSDTGKVVVWDVDL